MTDDELLAEIEAQRALMVAVATGGPRIEDVNNEYRQRRIVIARALAERGLNDPNPYNDLCEWYGKWSSDFAHWQQRRSYVTSLFAPLISQLTVQRSPRASAFKDEPTGWERVDRGVDKVRYQFGRAEDEEDFQQIGLLCREILISLAQAVYDSARHEPPDGTTPSTTDAKRMLEGYFAYELSGGSNAAARKHARAALDLANDLQHRRTATFNAAALCAEATVSVVNIVAIVSGRRDNASLLPAKNEALTHFNEKVIEHLSNLTDIQRSMLKSSFAAASDGSGSLIFGWTTSGGGLCPMESQLIFLLDNDAVVPMREERRGPQEIQRWYRFRPWLFEYLKAHPEVLASGE